MTDCKFCGGTKELRGFGCAPEPCPACADTGKANPFAPLETPGWTEVTKPVPDPRVTALVTAAKGIDAFAEHRITCSMRRIQTQHIPCSCGLSPARKDLTAALEAFPND